jgi:DMSO/TMAO reductase YedYZ molybdopterin-dependent catalytic subunit
MNDQPIPFKHGYPLRLIVPQWYAMASVKWLRQITLVDQPFHGPFQSIDYVYYPDPVSDAGRKSVTTIRVNSLIQQPLDLQILDVGTHIVQGLAWSGAERIAKVEVSMNQGESWELATLYQDPHSPYAWTAWSYEWKTVTKGTYTLLSRATDFLGRTQPLQAEWNRKGYGYNAVFTTRVKVD